jgi:hypothetical protein
VQRVVQRFADQDIEAALKDIDPEATLDWSNSDALDSGVYTSHAAWRAFMQARDDALGERHFDSAELLTPPPIPWSSLGECASRDGRAAQRSRLAVPPYGHCVMGRSSASRSTNRATKPLKPSD